MVAKKILSLMVAGILTFCLMPVLLQQNIVKANDNDNFLVTMYGYYLECNIINASWDIGTVLMSHSNWTNETHETEKADTHNSTTGLTLDFEMVISVDGTDWKTVWSQNYTTGPNQYKLNASSDSWSTQNALNVSTYADVKTIFAPSDNATFDLRFDSPTSTNTGAGQSITLNGKVTLH
jgi:hypothetical protein